MNTNFVNIIKRIITEQGEAILGDPARLKGFVHDYAKNEAKEDRVAFGRCIEMGAYTGLKNTHTPAERQQVKAAFLPHIQSASGLSAAQCRDALDALEAAMFGVQVTVQPPVYQLPKHTPPPVYPPPQYVSPHQPQYQLSNLPPPASNTSGTWTAVLVLNILGLNYVSRFITGHIATGILVLLLDIITIATLAIDIGFILFFVGLIIWIVDLVKIGTKKWQTADGTYLVP